MVKVDYDNFVRTGYATISDDRRITLLAVYDTLWKFISMTYKNIFDDSAERIRFLQNFFYPIINRSVCKVSIDFPTTTKRFCNFMLKAFRVVENDAPEIVNGTIRCIDISTGKRDYWQTQSKFFFFWLYDFIRTNFILFFCCSYCHVCINHDFFYLLHDLEGS